MRRGISILMVSIMCLWGQIDGVVKKESAEPIEVFAGLNTKEVSRVVSYKGELYMLECYNHKISVINPEGVMVRAIGSIGKQDGELYYPGDIGINRSGVVVTKETIDMVRSRIQLFKCSGEFISSFFTEQKAIGIGIDSRNYVYTGILSDKHKINVYNREGKLVRRTGKLLKPSEIYGNEYHKKDRLTGPMNRVKCVVDNRDNLWLIHLFLPIIEKYDPDGKLLFRRNLTDMGLEDLIKGLLKGGRDVFRKYLSVNYDGVQLPVILSDMFYDSFSNRVVVLMGNNKVVFFSETGQVVRTINPDFKKGALQIVFCDKFHKVYVRFFNHDKFFELKTGGK